MEKERTAIIELFVHNNSQSEIMKLLNIPRSRRKFVYRTIKRYQDTGSILDKPRSGRPVTVTTKKMKNVVRCRIWRNPRRSLRKMASDLKISQGSLRKIVKRDLGLYSFKRKRVHFLSQAIQKKRLLRSK